MQQLILQTHVQFFVHCFFKLILHICVLANHLAQSDNVQYLQLLGNVTRRCVDKQTEGECSRLDWKKKNSVLIFLILLRIGNLSIIWFRLIEWVVVSFCIVWSPTDAAGGGRQFFTVFENSGLNLSCSNCNASSVSAIKSYRQVKSYELKIIFRLKESRRLNQSIKEIKNCSTINWQLADVIHILFLHNLYSTECIIASR